MNQDGVTRPIIWPLREKLRQAVFLQTRPRWTGGRGIPMLPTIPWDTERRPPTINFGKVDIPPNAASVLPSNFGLCVLNIPSVQRKLLRIPAYSLIQKIPSVVHSRKPLPATFFTISGITKDSTGAILGGCVVELFITSTDQRRERKTSDANGLFYFTTPVRGTNHYIVAYKAGSPDVAGTTVNTLTPV